MVYIVLPFTLPQSVPVKVGWTWVSASKYLVKMIAVRGLGLPYQEPMSFERFLGSIHISHYNVHNILTSAIWMHNTHIKHSPRNDWYVYLSL